MPDYVAWHEADARAGGGASSTHEEFLPPPPQGATWVEIAGSCFDTTLAMVGGVRTEVPISLPADSALALARVEMFAAAKAYRDERQGGGCLTAIGRVSTDPERSIGLLAQMGAAAAGSIAAKTAFPYSTWTLADGTTKVPLTPSKGVAANAVVGGMLDACQQAYEAIKAQIGAAPSLAALTAIDITAGYPV